MAPKQELMRPPMHNIQNDLKTLMTVGQSYDALAVHARDLEAQLNEALTALEGRNARVLVLEEAMHTERTQYQDDCARRDKEVANYRRAADQAIGERNELRITLNNLRTLILAADLPANEPATHGNGHDLGEVDGEGGEAVEAHEPRIRMPRAAYPGPA